MFKISERESIVSHCFGWVTYIELFSMSDAQVTKQINQKDYRTIFKFFQLKSITLDFDLSSKFHYVCILFYKHLKTKKKKKLPNCAALSYEHFSIRIPRFI